MPHCEQDKISAALLDLIDPYVDSSVDLDDFKSIVGVAALAWNLSHLSKSEQVRQMRKMYQDPEIREPELLIEVLQDLMARKSELFPDDSRLVVGWQVRQTKRNSFYVTALCTT